MQDPPTVYGVTWDEMLDRTGPCTLDVPANFTVGPCERHRAAGPAGQAGAEGKRVGQDEEDDEGESIRFAISSQVQHCRLGTHGARSTDALGRPCAALRLDLTDQCCPKASHGKTARA